MSSEQLDYERLPQNLEAAIDLLGAHLEAATRDTGKGYIVEFNPQNPDNPSLYRVDIRITGS